MYDLGRLQSAAVEDFMVGLNNPGCYADWPSVQDYANMKAGLYKTRFSEPSLRSHALLVFANSGSDDIAAPIGSTHEMYPLEVFGRIHNKIANRLVDFPPLNRGMPTWTLTVWRSGINRFVAVALTDSRLSGIEDRRVKAVRTLSNLAVSVDFCVDVSLGKRLKISQGNVEVLD